jgi:hypothetical protein
MELTGEKILSSPKGDMFLGLWAATNGREQLLFSALPVVDPGAVPRGSNLIFPQIVDGRFE